MGLLNSYPIGRKSACEVMTSSEWLAKERYTELPETLTTLAIANQMSRPHVEVSESALEEIFDFFFWLIFEIHFLL